MFFRRLICICLSLAMFCMLVGCQSSNQETKEAFIAPPIKVLEWGMTIDEVQTALSEAGVEATVNESTGSYWIDLSAADAISLGLDSVAGMAYNTNSLTPISILFLTDSNGLARFTSIQADVVVPTEEFHLSLSASKEVMNEALTKVYGEPVGDAARWGTTGKKIAPEDANKLSATQLTLLESNDYDAFYVYPMLNYSVEGIHNLEVTLMYEASGYVQLIYGNF